MYFLSLTAEATKSFPVFIAWNLVSGNEICIVAAKTAAESIREMQLPRWQGLEAILIRTRAGVNLVCQQQKNTNKNTGKPYYHINIMVIMSSVDDRYRRP